MQAEWVDEGNDPDYATVDKYSIKWLFFALRDPRVTQAYLQAVVNRGYTVGVHADWNWGELLAPDGATFANKVHVLLQQRVPNAKPSFPKVQFNMELHDPQYVIDMVKEWRRLRPTHDTSWTMEGMQGGWMTPEMVKVVKDCGVRVVPQCYNADMSEVWSDLAVYRDLLKRGFEDARISPFYDAADLPKYWNGWAFTEGRLPRDV